MIIVITGATSGIGEATALYLASKGHIVYSLARRLGTKDTINYLQCDVTKKEDIINALKTVAEKEGKIDAIVNNAGFGISGAVEFNTYDNIEKIIDINFNGVVSVTKEALPYLRQSKGRIVNIGSIAGELSIPFQTMYSATKSAVHRFSLGLANELRPFGVKVSCVMPGDTKTSFTQNRQKNEDDNIYNTRVSKSVTKMEKDEQNGASPLCVAKVIEKCLIKKNPPLKVAVGFQYKFLVFLSRFMPQKLISRVLYHMYGE